ncbi:hypothetical protein EVAR_795_1 [Eumeta japonica]|uniref:Reverse transcriptase domain-containing protein n=1 Tax=Eumeta variegata TaxID=151549 RepID=A0A4C1SF18_EUMVA|nr:hypothetical protein EVAR_795_1 [Eumeta japonica]
MDELSVKCLLYADDQVILAPSSCGLQKMVNKKNDSIKNRSLKVDVGKTKVIVFKKGESTSECDIHIEVDQVKEFIYSGSLYTTDGKHDTDIERRVNAGIKKNGALLAIMNSKSVSRNARLTLHNDGLISTLMYGNESWLWQK